MTDFNPQAVRTFFFYFRDGTKTEGKGTNVLEALCNAGYSIDTVDAIDFWSKWSDDVTWDDSAKKWAHTPR
jgi:hypothetical protein